MNLMRTITPFEWLHLVLLFAARLHCIWHWMLIGYVHVDSIVNEISPCAYTGVGKTATFVHESFAAS